MADINPFEILPIKPNFNKKDIKRASNKLYIKYHPDKANKANNDELRKKLTIKYNDITLLINTTLQNLDNNSKFTQTEYNNYRSSFKRKLNGYKLDKLQCILEENDLESTGNKQSLINEILDNVPLKIAELNIWEVNERAKYKPNWRKELREYENNFLIRILEIKKFPIQGDKFSLIEQIVLGIDEDEIPDLINQVKEEIKEYRNKLNKLNQNQLKIILENNNLKSNGNKDVLIKKILDNILLSELDNNIKQASINKDKALKKLFDITGEKDFKSGFKNTLKSYGLTNQHGMEIRNKLISKINNYKVAPENVEKELNKILINKSKEIERETLDKLYRLVGKTKHNSKFSKQLKDAGLDDSIGDKIKNEIIAEIKSKNLKKDDIIHVISFKINNEEQKLQDEKLAILYDFTGKTSFKSSFSDLLKESFLSKKDGSEIKQEMINSINDNSIDKEEIIPQIKKIIKNKKIEVMLLNMEESFLNQIVILNNFKKESSKEKQVKSLLNNVSNTFNDKTIENDISKINSMKIELNRFYKKQLEFVLKSNNLSFSGTKNNLINDILSNLHLDMINLYINELNNITSKLNDLTLNELLYILKINELSVNGDKSKVINEINKNLFTNEINNGLKSISELITKLYQLNKNELDYIAKQNNIPILKDAEELALKIKNNINISTIASCFKEIEEIKGLVYFFNDIQRKHFLIVNNLPLTSDTIEQCNEILENASLEEIADFYKLIQEITIKLNSFSRNQLHYILINNNQNISLDKQEQINIILNNLFLKVIQKDIKTLEEIEYALEKLDENEIEELIEINSINKSMTKSENIDRILESIPIKTLQKNLSKLNSNENHKINRHNLKKMEFIGFTQEKNGKKTIPPIKNNGLKLLIIFENEQVYNEYIANSPLKELNISKLKKPYDYFKNIVTANNIDGILFKMSDNAFILKSEQIT